MTKAHLSRPPGNHSRIYPRAPASESPEAGDASESVRGRSTSVYDAVKETCKWCEDRVMGFIRKD